MVIVERYTAVSGLAPASRPAMAAMLQAVLDFLDLDGGVDLQLVDDPAMALYNAQFLGLTGPTNVLAFPAENEGEEDEDALGQIVLNLDMLDREALLYGQEPVEHLARLLSHAALHLAGHEHGELMEALTDEAMDAALEAYSGLEATA